MDGLVLDFDGVVIDSEPIHLACFQRVLKPLGVELSRRDYYARYLGFDDRQCLRAILADRSVPCGEGRIDRLVAAKTALVQSALAESARPLPGVVELIALAAAAAIPQAICSSALREEIEQVARSFGIRPHLAAIVAAEDVAVSKPDPACYRLTVQRLQQAAGRPLDPARCLAVEDSPFGIAAARGTGLRTLAVTNSYPAGDLRAADRVVDSLAGLKLKELEELMG